MTCCFSDHRNAILVTLAAFNTIPVTLQLTGVSLASFVVSAFIAGNIGHRVGEIKLGVIS
jgi:hypothetical protein